MTFLKKTTLTLAIITSISANAWDIGELGSFAFEKAQSNVYVLHSPIDTPNVGNEGFMNNPGIIIGKDSITLIDPGSSLHAGKNLIKEINKISDKPVLAVFNTHVHGDHWLGNQAFYKKDGSVKLYASKDMIQQAKDGEGERWAGLLDKYTEGLTKDTIVTVPDNEVKHLDVIKVGDQDFRVHRPSNTAHTNTDIMIEHVQSKTLFLGDNLFNGRLGRFDDSSDMHNNIETLIYAKGLNMNTYVPGHGQSGSASESLDPYLNYLLVIKKSSYAGYEDDLEDYEVKPGALEQLDSISNWHSFNTVGLHINKFLSEIEARDE